MYAVAAPFVERVFAPVFRRAVAAFARRLARALPLVARLCRDDGGSPKSARLTGCGPR